MIRRLRHKIFGHGLDGHKFVGYYQNEISLYCQCRKVLRFRRMTNFWGFEVPAATEELIGGMGKGPPLADCKLEWLEPDAVPAEDNPTREAGELNRHGTR